MPLIDQFIILYLDGEPPSELKLPTLLHLDESVKLVEASLKPYMSDSCEIVPIRIFPVSNEINKDRGEIGAPGLTVVYIVGHGWSSADGSYQTSVKFKDGPAVLSGAELIKNLVMLFSSVSPLLLLVDTCEAESLESDLHLLPAKNVTAIFASAKGEHAWNLITDRGTRFAFALSEELGKSEFQSQSRDAVELHLNLESRIEKDVSAPHQTVTRMVKGRPIQIESKLAISDKVRRNRARLRLFLRLLAFGFLIAATIGLLAWYWHNHVFVFVDMKQLCDVCEHPSIVVFQANPKTNSEIEIKRMRVDGHTSAWMFLPADNLIVSIEADYHDLQERKLRFHQVFQPGFFTRKSSRLILPDAQEVNDRPGMALVSADSWVFGAERKAGSSVSPFWIDIRQVTIREYYPHLVAICRDGDVEPYASVLLTEILRSGDFDAENLPVDLAQLQELLSNEDLLIHYPESPAPMTEVEAEILSSRLGKSLPTPHQWELAARGVDGRQFPWGELVDRDRVNAGLPSRTGWAHRRILRPSTDYPLNRSPFGVYDMVGNAGDWVCDEEQYGFMGGELRLNAEKCTTYWYLRLPSNHSGLAIYAWQVGFRGTLPSALD